MQLNPGSTPPDEPARSSALRAGVFGLVLAGIGFVVGYLLRPPPEPQPVDEAAVALTNVWLKATHASGGVTNSTEYRRGAAVARTVCVTCHLFPEPDELDKVSWGLEVLPRMVHWVGGLPYDFANHPGGALVREAGVFPASPLIPVQDWKAVCVYYLEAAPSSLPPPAFPPRIQTGLKRFRAVTPGYRRDTPMTTLVKIAGQKLYVGDAGTKTLERLNAAGQPEISLAMGGAPVSLTMGAGGWHVALLGEFFGSDEPNSKVLWLEPPKSGGSRTRTLVDQAPRTTDTVVADLDGDGKQDLVVSHFGNILGRFSWYRNAGENAYEERVLLNRPGAVRSYVRDFNGDGRSDIMVLMAQAWEGVWLFLNQGGGQFEETVVLKASPAWGFTDFELADFNGDGFVDIIAANGDSGDNIKVPPTPKPYHGIRIYLNDGKSGFAEAYFHPMNGAYKVLARDYDEDGDLDVAAVSFYPDYERTPQESFLYLENVSERGKGAVLRFQTFTIPEGVNSRWVTADAGDLDGDGDIDLVLGAFQQGFSPVPEAIAEGWKKNGQALLILVNEGK
ncbi:MAG: VCBS repeat-containing protein [Verrucomicrobiota bacterium]